jgi:hypothetical protein
MQVKKLGVYEIVARASIDWYNVQCSDSTTARHRTMLVSSALTRGYLYAAATPMSIFGSLGMVIAGFKTLVACFSLGDVDLLLKE